MRITRHASTILHYPLHNSDMDDYEYFVNAPHLFYQILAFHQIAARHGDHQYLKTAKIASLLFAGIGDRQLTIKHHLFL